MKAQEGVFLWKHLLSSTFGVHVMVLGGYDWSASVQRKGLIMHSWLTHLQVLTQRKSDEEVSKVVRKSDIPQLLKIGCQMVR
ncbi:hypothetical protein Tco_0835325 [Tanacetum coccineum]